jgi:hypothetical protein
MPDPWLGIIPELRDTKETNMENKRFYLSVVGLVVLALVSLLQGCAGGRESGRGSSGGRATEEEIREILYTNTGDRGLPVEIEFRKGRAHNHPLMAIWAENMQGDYIQTLYVAQSIAAGVFRHGDASTGRWMPGPVRRPAALPYWGHQRGIRAADGYYLPTQDDPLPDAMTGPTPKSHFIVRSRMPEMKTGKFRVLLEVNQSWDWNQYWTNTRYPDDEHYMSSSQPAVVYEAVIDPEAQQVEFLMTPVGHSHWSGATGELFPDLGTLTTALEIAGKITVRLMEANNSSAPE